MFHMLSALVSEQCDAVFDYVEITVLYHYNRSATIYFTQGNELYMPAW
jgi:hypothetical protein